MYPLAQHPYLHQPMYNPYLPKVAFEMPSMSELATNPYVVGGLGGAGLGLGAAGLYDYFSQGGGPPNAESASASEPVDGPFTYTPVTAIDRAPEEIRGKLKIYNRVASLHPDVRGTASRLAWAMFQEGYSPDEIEKALLSLQSAGALAPYEQRGGVIPDKYFDSTSFDVNTLEALANRLGVASWLKNYASRPVTTPQ